MMVSERWIFQENVLKFVIECREGLSMSFLASQVWELNHRQLAGLDAKNAAEI